MSATLFILVPFFIIFVIVIIGYTIFSSLRKYKAIATFECYKKLYPQLVHAHGIECFRCGGRQIYIRQVGNIGSKVLNLHVCKTCGKNLYRSES